MEAVSPVFVGFRAQGGEAVCDFRHLSAPTARQLAERHAFGASASAARTTGAGFPLFAFPVCAMVPVTVKIGIGLSGLEAPDLLGKGGGHFALPAGVVRACKIGHPNLLIRWHG